MVEQRVDEGQAERKGQPPFVISGERQSMVRGGTEANTSEQIVLRAIAMRHARAAHRCRINQGKP